MAGWPGKLPLRDCSSENEENLLPIPKGSRLGLYGAGAVKTVKGGTGSGDVNERHSVTIYEGLTNAGYQITSGQWLDSYLGCMTSPGRSGEMRFSENGRK